MEEIEKRYIRRWHLHCSSRGFCNIICHLSSINMHIQFTVEKESDHFILILDVLLSGWNHVYISLQQANTHHQVLRLIVIPPLVIRSLCDHARDLSTTSESLQRVNKEKNIVQALLRVWLSYTFDTEDRLPWTAPRQLPESEQPEPMAKIILPFIFNIYIPESIKHVLDNKVSFCLQDQVRVPTENPTCQA